MIKIRFTVALLVLLMTDVAAQSGHNYSTDFTVVENPLSQNDQWIEGKTTGLDWTDAQVLVGVGGVSQATGTAVSPGPPYNDATAVVTGSWLTNQAACATVHTVNKSGGVYQEAEIRLRTTITPHTITGYEFNFSMRPSGANPYLQIVRWNGPLNNFTLLDSRANPTEVNDGDSICATANGSTLTMYVNGTAYTTATDSTYTGGAPGIGFYISNTGIAAMFQDFGFKNFNAWDSTGTVTVPRTAKPDPPRNLTATPQ
jgi:hypothetical protein